MTQLADLSRPIDQKYVEKKPGKGDADYVAHGIIRQYLIGILRQVPQTTILRELYDGEKLTGCLMRMTVTIDGVQTTVEDFGSCENPTASNNGERAKNASSDAFKRCAMGLGNALHLWNDHYFLHTLLSRDAAGSA